MTGRVNSPVARVLSPTKRIQPPGCMTVLQPDSPERNASTRACMKEGHQQRADKTAAEKDLVYLVSDSSGKKSMNTTKREEKQLSSTRRKQDKALNDYSGDKIAKDINKLSLRSNKSNVADKDKLSKDDIPLKNGPRKDVNPKASEMRTHNETGGTLTSRSNHNEQEKTNMDNKVPLDLLSKFLSSLMVKDYGEAKLLCQQILTIDPENVLCKDFQSTIDDMIVEIKNQEQTNVEQTCNGDGILVSSSSEESSEEEEDEQSDGDDEEEDEDDDTDEDDSESDESDEEDANVLQLNLLMGGVPVRKNGKDFMGQGS